MPSPPPLLQKSIFSVLYLHLANHWTLVCDFQLKFAMDLLSLYFCLDPFWSHSHQRKQRSKRNKQTLLLQIWFYFDLRDNSRVLYRRKSSKLSKSKHHPWNHHFCWTSFLCFGVGTCAKCSGTTKVYLCSHLWSINFDTVSASTNSKCGSGR